MKRISKNLVSLMLTAMLLWMMPGLPLAAQGNHLMFPEEALSQRIDRIGKHYQQEISFDRTATQNIQVAALKDSNLTMDKTLDRSLQNTQYTYTRTNDAYVIHKRASKRSEVSVTPTPAPAQTGAPGTLRGKVLDETGDILPGATVQVVDGGQGTATDADGGFSLKLPAGTYTLEVGFMGYQTQRVTDVKVTSGKTTPLDITLGQANTELDEVVVTATYNQASAQGLYARQKNIAAMSDGVSADLIKKTSDNNVAQVLKRVSGVTIDGGKYVTVRGMSERYNNVQLNGASLPSTEPNRRNFSFDVIPTGLVDNITIAKTFTPDLPGEFTGGLVEVNTLAVPDKRFLNLSVGTGWNSISTGKDFLSNIRYNNDWFLGEIKQRQWYTGQTVDDVKQNLDNAGRSNTYPIMKFTGRPVQNYSFTAGVPYDFGRAGTLGFVTSLTYRHEENREELVEGKMLTQDYLFRPGNRYKFNTAVGAVANVGWQLGGHKVTWRNLFNNRFTHTNMTRYVYKDYDATIHENYEQYSTPLQSQLWQTQLDGEHKLFGNKLIATWNGSYNQITRTNPDDRLLLGTIIGQRADGTSAIEWYGHYGNRLALNSGHLMYSQLKETKKNVALNLQHSFVVAGNRQNIKAGYMGGFRDARFEQQYLTRGGIDEGKGIVPFAGEGLMDYFDPKHFEDGTFIYEISGMQSATSGADYYTGTQNIHAGYLMGEFSFLKKLRLIAGARVEKTDMEVTTRVYDRNAVGAEEAYSEKPKNLKQTDWLPAATLIYSPLPDLNIRAAYGKTLARPDFRELSPAGYYNVDDRMWVMNTNQIEATNIHNWDVRAEWYPRPGEVLSIGYFYKKFLKPVEPMVTWPNPTYVHLIPMNLDESTIKGMELNWRKSFGFIAPAVSFVNNLFFTGNLSFVKGNVQYNAVTLGEVEDQGGDYAEFNRDRPLQGLSPYIVNLGLAYEGERMGAAINYNRNGRTLVLAGTSTMLDQYENPRDELHIQLSARFLQEKLEVKFNASDILNQDIILYRNVNYTENKGFEDLTDKGMNYNEGDWVMSRIRKGVNFSVSASWKF